MTSQELKEMLLNLFVAMNKALENSHIAEYFIYKSKILLNSVLYNCIIDVYPAEKGYMVVLTDAKWIFVFKYSKKAMDNLEIALEKEGLFEK